MLGFRISGRSAVVARLFWEQEVGGSNPSAPTTHTVTVTNPKNVCTTALTVNVRADGFKTTESC